MAETVMHVFMKSLRFTPGNSSVVPIQSSASVYFYSSKIFNQANPGLYGNLRANLTSTTDNTIIYRNSVGIFLLAYTAKHQKETAVASFCPMMYRFVLQIRLVETATCKDYLQAW
jgi:hypothetical protein